MARVSGVIPNLKEAISPAGADLQSVLCLLKQKLQICAGESITNAEQTTPRYKHRRGSGMTFSKSFNSQFIIFICDNNSCMYYRNSLDETQEWSDPF
jgi:hypothetical protein